MAEHPVRHRCILVDLISNSLRYRKIPAMLSLRPNEKLLDAHLSLAEIFRLVSYSEHVPYALLILPMGAPLAIRERPRAAAFRVSCSLCWHCCSTVAKCIKKRRARSTSDRLD
jgi:hypothetical protein